MLVLLAALPIVLVSVLMIFASWSASRAMPLGFVTALIIAAVWWNMPAAWIAAATVAGIINAIDILIIVFGAVVLLQLLRKSGGIRGIAWSITRVSPDRRIQLIVIAWLMGGFLEAAAGFGTPAAVAAPLLVGMGFPPLIAAIATLMADSTLVTFGAVGVSIWGGFAALEPLVGPQIAAGQLPQFAEFLGSIGAYAGLLHLFVGTFIPLTMVAIMTRITTGSFRPGLAVWPAALVAGLLFTVPQALVAAFVGPELPALIGAGVGLAVFIPIVARGFLTPRVRWELPPHSTWPAMWEGSLKAGAGSQTEGRPEMGPFLSWLPYIIIGVLLLGTRLQILGLAPLLRAPVIGWTEILGTTIGRTIAPLYNPGVFPFMLVALLIPLLHGLPWRQAAKTWRETLVMVGPAAVALVFALGMVYILINSGEAAGRDSMLIVLAQSASDIAGPFWYPIAPLVGALGAFISGSNTVSNIMFGPFQLGTALSADLAVVPVLALQAVGGAAGNMICVHNVVAVLTTVGLIGREGQVIRSNLPVSLIYCVLVGIIAWILVSLSIPS